MPGPDKEISPDSPDADSRDADSRDAASRNADSLKAGSFDIRAIAEAFPETADSLLLDTYLTQGPAASARVFRVYRGTPAHYHVHSDEFLYVVSGRGTFWMNDAASVSEFSPGILLCFKRGTVHAMPAILEGPVVFLAIDAPPRDPLDIVFVNPEDGTPESFIRPAGF